jgi:transposase-like protein
MQRNTYSTEFKEQALLKARHRGPLTLDEVALELHVTLGTLKGWLKTRAKDGASFAHAQDLPQNLPAAQWSAAQRLAALLESHGLSEQELGAWCRTKGIFAHQLKLWHADFSAPHSKTNPDSSALRQLQSQHEQLQRELSRKEKALAEAAALLVLQKKFQALWCAEDK